MSKEKTFTKEELSIHSTYARILIQLHQSNKSANRAELKQALGNPDDFDDAILKLTNNRLIYKTFKITPPQGMNQVWTSSNNEEDTIYYMNDFSYEGGDNVIILIYMYTYRCGDSEYWAHGSYEGDDARAVPENAIPFVYIDTERKYDAISGKYAYEYINAVKRDQNGEIIWKIKDVEPVMDVIKKKIEIDPLKHKEWKKWIETGFEHQLEDTSVHSGYNFLRKKYRMGTVVIMDRLRDFIDWLEEYHSGDILEYRSEVDLYGRPILCISV